MGKVLIKLCKLLICYVGKKKPLIHVRVNESNCSHSIYNNLAYLFITQSCYTYVTCRLQHTWLNSIYNNLALNFLQYVSCTGQYRQLLKKVQSHSGTKCKCVFDGPCRSSAKITTDGLSLVQFLSLIVVVPDDAAVSLNCVCRCWSVYLVSGDCFLVAK